MAPTRQRTQSGAVLLNSADIRAQKSRNGNPPVIALYSGVGTTEGGTVPQARYAQNCRDDMRLSDRELRILRDVAAGATNEEVAASLNLSVHTVAGHLRAMLSRSQARNRAELVARAYAAGVLLPGVWPPILSGRRCLPPGS